MTEVAKDGTLTVDQKLTKMDRVLKIPPTASAHDLARALGVSSTAIKKTGWWETQRKGRQDECAGKREQQLREKGKAWENPAPDD
ncbi:MAG: hypothetical protein GYA33_16315 [Thermogutta sp.]|nr:hypothetical protein [Thermogutta sp.]